MRKMWLVGILISLVVAGDGLGSEGMKPKSGGTLIFGRGADSITLDPALSKDSESGKVIQNLFEGLVRYKDDSTDIEPLLAHSWDTSNDEKEWTFHLREGVHFHDGTPFNAHAVVASFMRQIDPEHPFFRKDFPYADFTFKYVRKVEALDELTVKVSLERPYGPFINNMAIHSARIVSPTALKKWGDDFGRHPVGTGPFVFEEWVPKDRVILKRNDNYWEAPAYLERAIFKSIVDNRDRLLELKTSAIHVMDGINPDDVPDILKNENLILETRPGLNVGYLAMNMEKKPFDQLKVRQALNHAINKENLVKLLYQGLAISAKNPIPPTIWSYNDSVADYGYDPEKARQLLKEAGYENGFETTLWAMPVPRPYMPQPEKIARIIQANLDAVGIRTEIVSHDWKTYISKISNGEHDMCLIGWISDNGDPDNFLYLLLDQDNTTKPKAQNFAFYRDDVLHEILIRAQHMSDKTGRTRLYQIAQEIIHDQVPWVPLVHANQYIAFHKNVHGVIQHPNGSIRLYKAWINR